MLMIITSTILLSTVTSRANVTIDTPKVEVTNVTWDAIELKWKSVKGAQGYHIFRYEESIERYIAIGEAKGLDTSYVDRDVLANGKYKYRVKAYATDELGIIRYSNASKTVGGETPANHFYGNSKKQGIFTGDELGILVDYIDYAGDFMYVEYLIKNLSEHPISLDDIKISSEIINSKTEEVILKKHTLGENDFTEALSDEILHPKKTVYLKVYYSDEDATMGILFEEVDIHLKYKYKLKELKIIE